MSVEEKRTRLLELFHEKVRITNDLTKVLTIFLFNEQKDVFLLKELEKMGPKEKGIVMQSVKDVLMSLVSDDLVESDKIGSSTYFWSFPSKTINTVIICDSFRYFLINFLFCFNSKKIRKIEELKTKINEIKSKSKQLDSELKKYEIDDKEVETRAQALQELQSLEEKRNQLKARLELLKDCDPDVLQQMKKDCNVSKEAINRWTGMPLIPII